MKEILLKLQAKIELEQFVYADVSLVWEVEEELEASSASLVFSG
ncbi:MAG: hypothetical protein AB4368_25860 [Xenococcaceae cyanobacterium]